MTLPAVEYVDLTEDELAGLPIEKKKQYILALRERPSAAGRVKDTFSRPTPQAFKLEVLGHKPTEAALRHGIDVPWTPDQAIIMDAVAAEGPEFQHIAIYSGNGIGKTKIFADIALWFLYNDENTIVVTTAPTATQVEELLWGEIRQSFTSSKLKLPGRQLMTSIKLGEKWYATGYTARIKKGDQSATAFQGRHSKRVVVLIDEATDVADEVWAAAERIAVGARDKIIAVGNPTDPLAKFSRIRELRRRDGTPMWHTIVCSGEDHPNVVLDDPDIIPGATTRRFIDDILDESGSRDSGVYRSAVLGQFPLDNPDALIAMSWISAAMRRWREFQVEPPKPDRRGISIGLDIASEGSDLTVLSIIENGVWSIPKLVGRRAWHQGMNVTEAAELLVDAMKQLGNVRAVAFDDTGVGNAVKGEIDKLRKANKVPKYVTTDGKVKDVWFMPVNFGMSSNDNRFVRAKDEAWWALREAFRGGTIAIPDDQEIASYSLPRGTNPKAQISSPIYRNVGQGRIEIYDKRGEHGRAEITKHLPHKSPDIAHSMMLAALASSRLRPESEHARPAAKDLQELFNQKTQEMIDKATDKQRRQDHDRKKTNFPIPPHMKRR